MLFYQFWRSWRITVLCVTEYVHTCLFNLGDKEQGWWRVDFKSNPPPPSFLSPSDVKSWWTARSLCLPTFMATIFLCTFLFLPAILTSLCTTTQVCLPLGAPHMPVLAFSSLPFSMWTTLCPNFLTHTLEQAPFYIQDLSSLWFTINLLNTGHFYLGCARPFLSGIREIQQAWRMKPYPPVSLLKAV